MYFRLEVIELRKTTNNRSERVSHRMAAAENRNFPKSRPIAMELGRLVALAELRLKKIYIFCAHAHSDDLKSRFSTFRSICGCCACVVRQARAAIGYGVI